MPIAPPAHVHSVDGVGPVRQIAALPYRATGEGRNGPVEVLLVTSRRTGRWVIPKGNRRKTEQPHVAAAREAAEEAGVSGAICPASLGSYEYCKTLRTGGEAMAQVRVYPLAVTEEHSDWPEAGQRTRRWFSLAAAAEAVAEPDLQALIRSFQASDFRSRSTTTPFARHVGTVKERLGMFHWFQNLLPRQGNFFELFEAHGQTLIAGSTALSRLLEGGPAMAEHIREVSDREHDADDITREVLVTVRRTFLTPFDRGAITSLITAMDDAIDQMHQTARVISLYEVTELEQEMRDMAAIIVDCARLVAEALPLLRSIHANAGRLHELTERLVRLEGKADDVHDAGLARTFKTHGESSPLRFVVEREIYSHLERVVDRFEDVANEIDGLVIDHA